MDQSIEELYNIYKKIIPTPFSDVIDNKKKFRLPIVPLDTLNYLLDQSQQIFEEESIILSLKAPILVIGDIHGHIFDLFRILQKYGLPPERKYLFLGDIVDRGEFSTETLVLLLSMKVLFRNDVFIIRGNHEFGEVANHAGFISELISLYGNDDIIPRFVKMFSYIPLAAKIDNYAICVHGGIGPSLFNEEQIKTLQRPITTFQDPIVTELLWSDPSPDVQDFAPSNRGMGVFYGVNPIKTFLQRSGCTVMFRGHQCVSNGFEYQLSYKVVTVFSASNYCGDSNNYSAVLKVEEDERYSCDNFPPLKYVQRHDVAICPIGIMFPKPVTRMRKLSINPFETDNKSRNTQKLRVIREMSSSNDVTLRRRECSSQRNYYNEPSSLNQRISKSRVLIHPVRNRRYSQTSLH